MLIMGPLVLDGWFLGAILIAEGYTRYEIIIGGIRVSIMASLKEPWVTVIAFVLR